MAGCRDVSADTMEFNAAVESHSVALIVPGARSTNKVLFYVRLHLHYVDNGIAADFFMLALSLEVVVLGVVVVVVV